MKRLFKKIQILWSILLLTMISTACTNVMVDEELASDVLWALEMAEQLQSQSMTNAVDESSADTEEYLLTKALEDESHPEFESEEIKTSEEKQTEAVTKVLETEEQTESATKATESVTEPESETAEFIWYEFATKQLFDDHYQKHVIDQKEYGNITQEEYLEMANILLNSTGDNILRKTEEDGDLLFYNVDTNEFAVLRTDGVIRTYFKPSAGIDYWNRQ